MIGVCDGTCAKGIWGEGCSCDQPNRGYAPPAPEGMCELCESDPKKPGQPFCDYCCRRYDAQRVEGRI